MQQRLSRDIFAGIVAQVPDDWLPADRRDAYADLLSQRLSASAQFVEEAVRARAQRI